MTSTARPRSRSIELGDVEPTELPLAVLKDLDELGACRSETRIGLFVFSNPTRTELLPFLTATAHRGYGVSRPETAMGSIGPAIDEPLAMLKNGTVSYTSVDGLGSVTAETAADGTVLHTATYDAWGNIATESGTRQSSFGYTGREYGEAGLMFYRARYYDPSLGRFTQEDPLGFQAGMNFYAYVANWPIDSTDPSGLELLQCSRPLTGGIGSKNPNSARRHVFFYSTTAKTGCGLGPKTSAGGLGAMAFGASVDGQWEFESPYDAHGSLKPGTECHVVSRDPNIESCAIGACSGTPPKYSNKGCSLCFDWVETTLHKCECQFAVPKPTATPRPTPTPLPHNESW